MDRNIINDEVVDFLFCHSPSALQDEYFVEGLVFLVTRLVREAERSQLEGVANDALHVAGMLWRERALTPSRH